MPKSKSSKRNTKKVHSKSSAINAVTIRRASETVQVDPRELIVPEWMAGTDPLFADLYKKYSCGQISGLLTRMPLDLIKAGFYLVRENFSYRCDSPPDDLVLQLIRSIQMGARPALHLYANKNPSCNFRFLCPDDVAYFLAYTRLGFGSVPAVVLAPGREPLPYSSLETKANPKQREFGFRVHGLVSTVLPGEVPSIIGSDVSQDPILLVRKISRVLNAQIARLRLFHVAERGQLHYHHMIFSALIRIHETLVAIDLLIEKNLWYQALTLLRTLYEIHLNFYFDWLQPETNYKFLAAAAVFSSIDVSRARKSLREELISQGKTVDAADAQASITWRPVVFASTVSEKARLPVVGMLYHKQIYDFLSRVTHQDFEVASLHANRFDDEKYKAIADNVKLTYLRFMDLVVSEFITCVESDIGVPYNP